LRRGDISGKLRRPATEDPNGETMQDTSRDRTAARMLGVKTAAFVLLYVGAVAVGIPALLVWWADGRLALGLGQARYLALAPMLAGVAFYLYCTAYLAAHGREIPAPLDPTRQLICSGPYAVMRNPMYVAASLYFCGLAVLFDSGVLVAYALLMMSAYWAGVVFLEEPALAQRFGPAFADYCRQTPRWFPALRHLGRTKSRRETRH
jgi:protein-S-isoprenylcysteine O-methyltransferase Ste14